MKAFSGLTAALLVILRATGSWGANNLNLSKSNINRLQTAAQVVTATTNLGPGESVSVYNTPASGDFLLTQFCASPDATGGVSLDVSGFGTIAQTTSTLSCFTFNPGVSVPKGSTLSCTTSAAGAPALSAGCSAVGSPAVVPPAAFFCTISGLQTTK